MNVIEAGTLEELLWLSRGFLSVGKDNGYNSLVIKPMICLKHIQDDCDDLIVSVVYPILFCLWFLRKDISLEIYLIEKLQDGWKGNVIFFSDD